MRMGAGGGIRRVRVSGRCSGYDSESTSHHTRTPHYELGLSKQGKTFHRRWDIHRRYCFYWFRTCHFTHYEGSVRIKFVEVSETEMFPFRNGPKSYYWLHNKSTSKDFLDYCSWGQDVCYLCFRKVAILSGAFIRFDCQTKDLYF